MFKKDDQVSFGIRQYWGGKGRPAIPRYTGTIFSVIYGDRLTKPMIWVTCPEYSNQNIAFTLRKNGNWVRQGDADDNFHGYSRVALQQAEQAWTRIGQSEPELETA